MRPRIYVGWKRVATAEPAPEPQNTISDLFTETGRLERQRALERERIADQAPALDPIQLDAAVLDAVVGRTRCLVREIAEDARIGRVDAEEAVARLEAARLIVAEGSRYEASEQVVAERLRNLLDRIGVDWDRIRPAWRFQWEAAPDPEQPTVFSAEVRRVRRERVHYFQVLRSGQSDQAYDNVQDELYDIIYSDFESAVLAVFRGPFGSA